jgi:hypothetical protein
MNIKELLIDIFKGIIMVIVCLIVLYVGFWTIIFIT